MTKQCKECGVEIQYVYRPPDYCKPCLPEVRRENRRRWNAAYRERSTLCKETKMKKIPEKYLVRGLK